MIIGVVSDTHSLLLSPSLLAGLKGVDLIIHAGDLCDADVLKALKAIAPVKAVQGNMDDGNLRKKLPLKEKIEVEGVKIGVYHGHGNTRDAMANAQAQFKDDPVDIIIFGHSHQPYNQQHGKTLMFNPGSPNDPIRAPYFSFGKITLKAGKFTTQIIRL